MLKGMLSLEVSIIMCSIAAKNTSFRRPIFCTPINTYHLGWNYAAQSFQKLEVAFNALRMLHSLPAACHIAYCSVSGMFTVKIRAADCKTFIRNMVHRCMMRLAISKHLLLGSILSSDLIGLSRIRRHWGRLLFVHFHGRR